MSERQEDLVNALTATTKSALGLVPGISQALAGYDAYRRSIHDRNVRKMIEHLNNKVANFENLFDQEWFKTEEGELFARKVIDAAIDVQSEEKQELFVNVLINGATSDITLKEKTKFVDILRQLSLSSIQILAEIHKMFLPNTRRPGKEVNQISAIPHIDAVRIAEDLSDRYEPYLVIASIKELESHGLFSNVGSWRKVGDKFISGQGFKDQLAYTDFSARFAEFISEDETKTLE